ncbi:MAG: PAS domain-containing sensor histidine kinase [Gammaproteobacteria bacterium]|nr:PAS domain-containing sensor histidine kinase [Gammaproteobacteria bacterium]MDH5694927.1 PAS domain-containing sensor histidine kinase [Gammaproteobacteria bacterium]
MKKKMNWHGLLALTAPPPLSAQTDAEHVRNVNNHEISDIVNSIDPTVSALLNVVLVGLLAYLLVTKFKTNTLSIINRSYNYDQDRLQHFFDASMEGLFFHENGIVTDINPAACQMIGYSRDEVMGTHILNYVPEKYHQECIDHMKSMDEGPYEFEALHKTGSRIPIRIRAKTLLTEKNPIRAVAITSLMNSKCSPNSFLSLDQIENPDGAFLSRMGHEFKKPLSTILGFTQILQHTELSDEQSQYTAQISEAGDRLLKMINAMHDFGKLDAHEIALEPENVDWTDILVESIDLVSPLIKQKSLNLLVSTEACERSVVFANRTRFRQVLHNLLSNAVLYNREHGNISIYCSTTNENKLRVSIEDSGIGIPEISHLQVFQPLSRFRNCRESIAGTGMGLAVCKKLIELMGGKIGFSSVENEGSCFWIELPLAQSVQQIAAESDLETEELGA